MPDRKLAFSAYGWETYTSWLMRDRTVLKAANKVITATLANPFEGIGKPEP
ncbi:type II toxin-antitoxin system YoeB family toxin, partial [Streptomyces anulatus]|uniref:type II toxin-antitoxin system YoeB family toxin n=1 Tax=Streptomyces anulatus TaxID=1892 RepID=UPI00367915BD